MPDNTPQKPEEALYLLDDNLYLHLQETEGGYDYSLYDKNTLRLVDGGLMDHQTVLESPIRHPMAAARMEIFEILGLHPERVTFQDLDFLEEIQAAQARYADEAIEEFMADYLADASRLIPDPTISIAHMNYCGCHDPNMLPISEDRAKELAERGVTVYQLFENNDTFRIDDPRDIAVFGGLYGITREDWERIKEEIPPRDVERRFFERPGAMMAIYQLKDTAPRELYFRRFDQLDHPPAREHYDCIYTREVHPTLPTGQLLEQQYYIYNVERPDDFTGHSLSISDIVALKRDGLVSYHYCDNFGFRELAQFERADNYLRTAEMLLEDDYGMIDGIINNGKSEAVQAEKKDSVLGQLQQPPDRPHKSTPRKNEERDLDK